MSQRIDPDSDIDAGSWGSTPLWSKIDDGASTNDADFVTSSTSDDAFQVGLSNPASAPGSGTTTVTFRAKNASGSRSLTVELFEGATSRGSTTVTITTTIQTFTFNPTGIVDYNDLSLVVVKDVGVVVVTFYWAKVDVPDAAVASNSIFFAGD